MIEASFRIHPGVNAVISSKIQAGNGVGEIGINAGGKVRHFKFLLKSVREDQTIPSFSETELISMIGKTVSSACIQCPETKGFNVRYISLPKDQGYSGWRWPYNDLLATLFVRRSRESKGRLIA